MFKALLASIVYPRREATNLLLKKVAHRIMSQVAEIKIEQSQSTMLTTINQVLTNNTLSIRIIGTTEEPWFSAKDIATQLGYKQPERAISDNIKDESFKAKLGDLIDKFKPGNRPGLENQGISLKGNAKNSIYINEAGVYAMVFGSTLPSAVAFKSWVLKEVLPSIRKTGSYQVNEQVQRLTSEVASLKLISDQSTLVIEEQKKIAQAAQAKADVEKKRADDASSDADRAKKEKLESDAKHKLDIDALELASAKTRSGFKDQLQTRDQHMYIITNDQNKAKDMYKVGRTKNHTGARVSTLNTGLINNESLYCVVTYDCADACSIEDRVHKLLAPHRDSINREWFQVPFAKLHTVITGVIKHQSDEYDWSCVIVDEIIGRPIPCGKDADGYLNAIAAATAAAIVPLETNETLA